MMKSEIKTNDKWQGLKGKEKIRYTTNKHMRGQFLCFACWCCTMKWTRGDYVFSLIFCWRLSGSLLRFFSFASWKKERNTHTPTQNTKIKTNHMGRSRECEEKHSHAFDISAINNLKNYMFLCFCIWTVVLLHFNVQNYVKCAWFVVDQVCACVRVCVCVWDWV